MMIPHYNLPIGGRREVNPSFIPPVRYIISPPIGGQKMVRNHAHRWVWYSIKCITTAIRLLGRIRKQQKPIQARPFPLDPLPTRTVKIANN